MKSPGWYGFVWVSTSAGPTRWCTSLNLSQVPVTYAEGVSAPSKGWALVTRSGGRVFLCPVAIMEAEYLCGWWGMELRVNIIEVILSIQWGAGVPSYSRARSMLFIEQWLLSLLAFLSGWYRDVSRRCIPKALSNLSQTCPINSRNRSDKSRLGTPK